MKRKNDETAAPVAIDGYTDFVRIGTGGFSVVYRAHELALNRNVAVKVLNAGLAEESDRRAFERECKALGQLDHPDIVRVYRPAYTVDDKPCIVMELYEGNFREVLDQRGALGPVELLDVGVRMAVALHVAHTKGVLHRDVKPHNIFRSRYGDPALGDFGISMIDDERSHSGASGLSIAYAAPELLDDGTTGVRTDVYALCATLHHLATGAAPFAAPDLRQSVRRILTDEPPPIGRSDLPMGFERVLRAGLAKDPAARPATALALAEMLREAQARGGHLQTPIKLEETAGDRAAPDAATAPPSGRTPGSPAPTGLAPGGPAMGGAAMGGPAMGGPVVRDGGTAPAASLPPPAAHNAGASPAAIPAAAATVSAATPGPAVGVQPGTADQSGGATIIRRQPVAPAAAPVEPGVSARRRLIAAGIVVAVVAFVAIGIVAFGGSDSSSSADSTAAPTIPPVDSFLSVIAAPADVTVTATDGSVSVAFTPVDGATSYLITPVGGVAEPVTVAATALPAVIPANGATSMCVTVQSIADGGRVSRPTAPVCSTG